MAYYLHKMIDEPLETRPVDVVAENWKNRHMVGAKLTHINYQALRKFCKDNNYSFSSGINNLIATYLTENNV